jgi:hypothetical protein
LACDAIVAIVAAMRRHCGHVALQGGAAFALSAILETHELRLKAGAEGVITAVMAAMHAHPDDLRVQAGCCAALTSAAAGAPENAASARAAGAVEALVMAITAHRTHFGVLNFGCGALAVLGDFARAVRAGAVELLSSIVQAEAEQEDDSDDEGEEDSSDDDAEEDSGDSFYFVGTFAQNLLKDLQPAVQLHDASPFTHAGCKRCAAARASGAMCALASCCARRKPDDGRKLSRCSGCRAAAYCGAAHQRDDWQRHRVECRAQQQQQQHEQQA